MVAVLEELISPEILPFQYDFLHAKNLFILSGRRPDTRQRLTATQFIACPFTASVSCPIEKSSGC